MGKPVAAEFLLNGRNVVAHLADGTESDLSQDQHQRLFGQRNVPATAFQRAHLTQNLTPDEGGGGYGSVSERPPEEPCCTLLCRTADSFLRCWACGIDFDTHGFQRRDAQQRQRCRRIREGARHSWWRNERGDRRSAVPRHREINDILTRKIERVLSAVQGGCAARSRIVAATSSSFRPWPPPARSRARTHPLSR